MKYGTELEKFRTTTFANKFIPMITRDWNSQPSKAAISRQ